MLLICIQVYSQKKYMYTHFAAKNDVACTSVLPKNNINQQQLIISFRQFTFICLTTIIDLIASCLKKQQQQQPHTISTMYITKIASKFKRFQRSFVCFLFVIKGAHTLKKRRTQISTHIFFKLQTVSKP